MPNQAGLRSRLLAFFLSCLCPGWGHLYLGQVRRWLFWWLTSIAAASLFLTGLLGERAVEAAFLLGLLAVWTLGSAVDAFRTASRSENEAWFTRGLATLGGLLAWATVVSFALPSFLTLKTFSIRSVSMEPALFQGEYFVARLHKGEKHPPRRGEIVMARLPTDPSNLFVSRVVAVGGDSVTLVNGKILVNGEVLPRRYGVDGGRRSPHFALTSSIILPEQTVYLLGDNRDLSFDSRDFGPVWTRNVVGSLRYVYWSPDRSRIGQKVQKDFPKP
jgi:signal peptidase I